MVYLAHSWHSSEHWTVFSEIFPFSALSFTLDKSNQAHKAMKLHFSKNGLISGDVCTSLSARLNHTQMNSEIFQKRATLKNFKLMLTPSLHICAWYKNYKWLSEGTSVESFCGKKGILTDTELQIYHPVSQLMAWINISPCFPSQK